jgi:hypothetical protein
MITAYQILESILNLFPLNERNVANIPELEDCIDIICKLTPYQEVKTWFQKRYLYYLKELYPVTKPVTSVDPDSPDWLQKALDRGDEVIEVSLSSHTMEEVSKILDCFTQLYDLSEFDLDSKRLLEKLLKTPMDKDFLDRIQDIMDNLAKAGIELVPGIVTSGYKWFKLKSPKAIKTEGEILGLCLKDERLDYAGKVRRGEVTLYSMRKHTNDPKATMEVDRNGLIVQVKGLHDEPPKGEYIKPCIEFINYGVSKDWFDLSQGAPSDVILMGAVDYRGRLYLKENLPPLKLDLIMKDGKFEWKGCKDGEESRLARWYFEDALQADDISNKESVFILFEQNKPQVVILSSPYYGRTLELIRDVSGDEIEEKYEETCIKFINYGVKKGFFDASKGTPDDLYHISVKSNGVFYSRLSASKSILWKVRVYDLLRIVDARQVTQKTLDEIEDFLKNGADPNEAENILMRSALQENNMDVVRLLVDYDFDLNKYYNNERTVIHLAISLEREEAVKLFLEHGADPNLIDRRTGYSPLNIAIYKKDNIFHMLLDHGADPNESENIIGGYRCPIVCSIVRWGTIEKLEMLQEHGVNLNIKCSGASLFDEVRHEREGSEADNWISLLKKYGAKE